MLINANNSKSFFCIIDTTSFPEYSWFSTAQHGEPPSYWFRLFFSFFLSSFISLLLVVYNYLSLYLLLSKLYYYYY